MENLFDDIAPTPTTRARPGGRFAPKAKPKQPPPKNVSASKDGTNVHVASSEGVSQNESHNAVAVSSSIDAPIKSAHYPDIHLNNENELNNVAAPSTISSTMVRMEELPNNGEDSFLSTDKSLQVLDNSVEVSLNTGFKSASGDSNTAMPESNVHSNFEFGKVLSAEIELDPFSIILPDPGTGNARKFQPKVKPRSRASNTQAIASASSGELPPCTNFVLQEFDGKRRPESQEGADLNPDCPMDNVTDPPFEIPRHEGLTNSADSPTLADFLQQDGTGEKEDDNKTTKSLKKNERSFTIGVEDKGAKTSRQTRKQAARKPAKRSLNKAIVDDDVLVPLYDFAGDELEEYNDEDEVVWSPKKKKASTNPKKKSVAKNGKTSGKRKKANGDLEKITEEPPKKFPHSTRRRKRCVDKALLDDEFLDQRTLPIRDIILLAEYKERLAKKEAATSKISSTNQSDGDFLHEANANNEEEFYGSDDEFRDPNDDDDQVSEKITSTAPLMNYQSFMEKAPRGKWSKQDTEMFYEAVRQFGTDFSMIQQLFPDKTRHQVKLKYKKEERQHPLLLSDAVNNRSKDLSFFKLVVERQKQNLNKEEQDAAGDASDLMLGDEVEESTPGTNEEVATTKQEQDHIDVIDQGDSTAFPIPEQSDDSEDDLQKWSQYQSAI